MCIFTMIVTHRESGRDVEEQLVVSAPEAPIVRDILQWAHENDTFEAMVTESDCGTVRQPQVMYVTPSRESPTYIVRAER